MKSVAISLILLGSFSSLAGTDKLINRATDKEFAGCHVLRDVDGYNQLYIGHSFKGNFTIGHEDEKLESVLSSLVATGSCREKKYSGASDIVLKASKGRYEGCSVSLDVDGYNQVYVNDSFVANYVIKNEDSKLERKIHSLVESGDCREQSYAGEDELIEKVLNNEITGCQIQKNVKGYLQLYVGKKFKGNYVINKEEDMLESKISSLIEKGICEHR